ncbi:MAG: tRNA preQ1(34) S-adenosylmethionine ribosyltransferase-isomerase QueA [Rhodospirillales bacterium]|nr:tRNA preQ1(34) S-adenosylmethionine ribosyltransferase-isomerase QueA [Rhodospirillales bacterium]
MKQEIDPTLNVDQFDFDLPQVNIAQQQMVPRDRARMLLVNSDGFEDKGVLDLAEQLEPGDLMVFNDTKVIPARLQGKRGQAKMEVTLHKRDESDVWRVFARPARKLKIDDVIDFAEGFSAQVIAKGEAGETTLKFDRGGEALMEALEAHGGMPLPPYIKREGLADGEDKIDYQTVFAKEKGAVAAPTAGLHFTPRLIETLDKRGVEGTTVTLHVGAGTFLPVKVDTVADHKMHSEWGCVGQETVDLINKTKATGNKVIAVGTTSMRLLESATDAQGTVHPFEGDTDIFITPGYKFGVVDRLLTNFHLPKSTLFMLVSAFAGMERMKKAYEHAIQSDYRFYSYGDCCLLTKEEK